MYSTYTEFAEVKQTDDWTKKLEGRSYMMMIIMMTIIIIIIIIPA